MSYEESKKKYNAKEEALNKAVRAKFHKGKKGPQHIHQMLGKKLRNYSDLSGEIDEYRTQRSIKKHESKKY